MSSETLQPENRRRLSNSAHLGIMGLLVVVFSPLTYYALRWTFGQPVQGSAEAVLIDGLINGHYIAIAILFSLIVTSMLYSVFVFRAQPGDYSDGPHIHGSNLLEAIFIIVPTIVVLGFGVWGFGMLNELTAPEDNEMVVKVTGFQFGWLFEYPELDGVRSSELFLPAGRQIRLEMTSRDVLHAFWVPEFRVKQDLVPGRETEVRITPTKLGTVRIRCAEVCGANHWSMLGTVNVVTASDFDAWAAEQAAAQGKGDVGLARGGE